MSVVPIHHDHDQPSHNQHSHNQQHVPDRVDTLSRLRRQMAVMSGMPDRRSAEPVGRDVPVHRDVPVGRDVDVLPLPDAVADLLPQRGIARGSIICCGGARSLVIALIAAVTRSGGQVGIVGLPRLNLLSAVEMGADLDRIAVVPEPGIDPVEVASVLLDGMDLVVLGLRGVNVPPSRSRVISGRVRQRSSSLMVVDAVWPGANARFDAQVRSYRHRPVSAEVTDLAAARRGYGRVAGVRLRVSAEGRDRRRRTAEVDVVTGGIGKGIRLVRSADTVVMNMESQAAVAN